MRKHFSSNSIFAFISISSERAPVARVILTVAHIVHTVDSIRWFRVVLEMNMLICSVDLEKYGYHQQTTTNPLQVYPSASRWKTCELATVKTGIGAWTPFAPVCGRAHAYMKSHW